ncbi:retrovirus-related pol polyprotein from transposon TNT 1-94 [Tanacetum coccineum]
MSPSTEVSSSTEACGSKPRSKTKKDRISQISCSNKNINKVEADLRIAKSSLNNTNRVSKTICNENVKHSVLNATSELVCATCHECMFDAIHDLYVSGYLNDVNARVKPKFRNDQIVKITGYGDYQLGNVTISRVYYVEDDDDLHSGSRDINLYTISLDDMLNSSPICFLSKAFKTKSWLWHRRMSHLNFGTLIQLAKQGLIRGLPKLKFKKNHLCSACSLGKIKKSSYKPKADDTNQEKLYLLHMDLCGPMPLESTNRKKYILAEAVNTSCYTQNRSIIRLRYNKTPYELMHDKKPDLSYLHVFGSLCYLTNDSEDLGILKAKDDTGIFVGYAPSKKAFRINNKRARLIMETVHVTFVELTTMASKQFSSGPAP